MIKDLPFNFKDITMRYAYTLITLLLLLIPTNSFAKDYSFSWSANAEPVEGYKLYYKKGGNAGPPFDGTDAAEGTSPVVLGKVTSITLTDFEDNTTYHYALTAFNGSEESDYTDIITVFPDANTEPIDDTPNIQIIRLVK